MHSITTNSLASHNSPFLSHSFRWHSSARFSAVLQSGVGQGWLSSGSLTGEGSTFDLTCCQWYSRPCDWKVEDLSFLLAVDQKLLSAPCHMATIGQLSSSKPTKDRAHSAGQTSQGEPTEFTCVLFTVPVTLIVYIWAEAYAGPTRAPGKAPHKEMTQRGGGYLCLSPHSFLESIHVQ